MDGYEHYDPAAGHEPGAQSGLSHLRCREIQAPIATTLLAAFVKALGRERALEIAREAIEAEARADGRAMAERCGDRSIAALARVIREVWLQDGAMEIEVLEETDERFRFDVTRCRYVDAYEAAGKKDYGECLSCCRDAPFAEGFNPDIELTRSETLMEGGSRCDFLYSLKV